MDIINFSKELEHIIPKNLDAERSMIYCLLADHNIIDKISNQLSENLFYYDGHKKIFNAIMELKKSDGQVDVVSVNDILERRNECNKETLGYLVSLVCYLPSSINYETYLNILNRDMKLRGILNVCFSTIESVRIATSVDKIMHELVKKVNELIKIEEDSTLSHVKLLSVKFINKMQEIMLNKSSNIGLKTEYPILDKTTNGLQRGDLIVLAARPSVGKTSYALNLISNIVNKEGSAENNEYDKSVIAFFSLEMSANQILERIYSNISKISMNDIKSANISKEKIPDIWNVHSLLYYSVFYIDDSAIQTPLTIKEKCQKLKFEHDTIDLVIIDYLQLMTLGDGKNVSSMNKTQVVGEISRSLKVLAKELDCPVVVLSQMSRNIETRNEGSKKSTPKLSDLRDSGSIEQDADIVLFLSREDESNKNESIQNMILSIAKHRQGELKDIEYIWNGQKATFSEKTY
ncbi:MAG: replicative DNA helicase [Christensenellaceae bacterium]|jgi:replicative DNA helicase|nr:replicative DNA helicase [Christensenellaceae bacterium]